MSSREATELTHHALQQIFFTVTGISEILTAIRAKFALDDVNDDVNGGKRRRWWW